MKKRKFTFDNFIWYCRNKLVFLFISTFITVLVVGKLISAFVSIWKVQFRDSIRPIIFSEADETLPTFSSAFHYIFTQPIRPNDNLVWYTTHESILNDLMTFKIGFIVLIILYLAKYLKKKKQALKRKYHSHKRHSTNHHHEKYPMPFQQHHIAKHNPKHHY